MNTSGGETGYLNAHLDYAYFGKTANTSTGFTECRAMPVQLSGRRGQPLSPGEAVKSA